MTVQNEAPEAQTAPWGEGAPPQWLTVLFNYAKARSHAPLDFQGAKVPKRIQALIEAGQLQSLEQMEEEVYRTNVANGWFEDGRTFGDDIALLHSEVSEAFEAFRDHGLDDVTVGTTYATQAEVDAAPPVKPEGVGSEFADILVRLLDSSRRHGINLRSEYVRKIAFNKTRGHKHGGKRI